jgi:hypothetical protein
LNLTRDKQLLIGLVTLVVLWFGRGVIDSRVFAPFREESSRLATLKEDVAGLESQQVVLARSLKQLTDWKVASLPPDRIDPKSKTPSALNAQRLYLGWLTDLAQLSGMEGVKVVPGSTKTISVGKGASTKYVAMSVSVTLETSARYGQLCTFLDHFQRARLMQRINRLNIESPQSAGDPVLDIQIEAEGLALTDAPTRLTIFPETTLEQAIDDSAAEINIRPVAGFPAKAPFRIRLGSGTTGEYANVTAIANDLWTIERGVDRTYARQHPEGATVEFAPVNPAIPALDTEAFRAILASNIFIKPPPPKEYKLKLGPFTEQAFARGESLNYTLPVSDYDPTLGKPELSIVGTLPPGLQLDRGVGKITWTPVKDQAIGKFPIKLEVRHPSAEKGLQSAEFNVVFREPNSVPTAGTIPPQVAYLGRLWSFSLPVKDVETPVEQLTFKLDNPPAGVTYDPVKRQLTWTPAAPIVPGEQKISVTITDNGVPAQSLTVSIPVKVEDDAAAFTFLVGSIAIDGVWQAWIYNRAADVRTILKQGDEVKVSDIQGTVSEIGKDFITLKQGDKEERLELGQNLRELPSSVPAAGPPAPPPVFPVPMGAVPPGVTAPTGVPMPVVVGPGQSSPLPATGTAPSVQVVFPNSGGAVPAAPAVNPTPSSTPR